MSASRLPRVGIDARMIQHSGIGTYIRENLKFLLSSREFDWTLFGDAERLAEYSANKAEAGFPIYSLKEQFFYPGLLNRRSLDLVHFPHYNIPLGYRRPFVVTIHDCIHLKYPPSKLGFLYARTLMRSACQRARAVLVDSLHTQRDLIERVGAPEEKIRVVYPGVKEDFAQDAQQAQPFGAEEYALYVGNIKPTKNVETLVRAFKKASAGQKMKLVLAGRDFMKDWTAQFANDASISFLGEVSREKLAALYRSAKLFIFPSMYEGFGLPPLEAMSAGVPVICSNATSLPEVVGDAAEIFDPRDADDLALKISGVWNSEEKRKELIALGKKNIQRFRWQTCAEKILQTYRECLR